MINHSTNRTMTEEQKHLKGKVGRITNQLNELVESEGRFEYKIQILSIVEKILDFPDRWKAIVKPWLDLRDPYLGG